MQFGFQCFCVSLDAINQADFRGTMAEITTDLGVFDLSLLFSAFDSCLETFVSSHLYSLSLLFEFIYIRFLFSCFYANIYSQQEMSVLGHQHFYHAFHKILSTKSAYLNYF